MPTVCPSMARTLTNCWLPAKVSAAVIVLRILDTCPLCGLGGLSLCLRGRSHERDQRVANGLLHRVSGRATKVKLLITGYHYVQHHGYHYGAPLGSELLLIRPSGN
jgi:hypothetical protein